MILDADNRLTALSAKGDPLEAIDRLVPWESFRGDIEAAVLTPETERKSTAGRKPIDASCCSDAILQSLYICRTSRSSIRSAIGSRLRGSAIRYRGCIPDGTTLWLFREKLARLALLKLFDRFDRHLGAKGYIARGGQIVDATIVPVPKQRNTREENEAIKSGETPKAWKKKPAKNRQKDKDARWTKKHGRSFYGYKNHVNADAMHKLIRRYDVSDAAVHDSQKLDALLDKANRSADVFADSAYRSAELTTVILVGQAAQGAVITTGSEAAQRGFKVIVAVDGIAAQDDYYEQYTLWHLSTAPLLANFVTLTSTDMIKF